MLSPLSVSVCRSPGEGSIGILVSPGDSRRLQETPGDTVSPVSPVSSVSQVPEAQNRRGTPALHLNEPAGGSCCDGQGLVWYCYCIYMTFVCLIQKKIFVLDFFKGRGCVESKNKTSAKRKSTMSSLDPSIIQVDSFKCRADVPLGST